MAEYSTWRPYDLDNVNRYVPAVGGVYLFRVQLQRGGHRVFYVGQSQNLEQRLLAHLQDSEPNKCIKDHVKNHIVTYSWVQITTQSGRDAEEAAKYREYKPECNVQVPSA